DLARGLLDGSDPVAAGKNCADAAALDETRASEVQGEDAETGAGKLRGEVAEGVEGVEPGAVQQHHRAGMLSAGLAIPFVRAGRGNIRVGEPVGERGEWGGQFRALPGRGCGCAVA